MEYSNKAYLNTVVGANANREDLSNTLYLTDGPQRPIVASIQHTRATNTTHKWREIGLTVASRTAVAGGGATYAEGGLPNANAQTPTQPVNVTCNVGRLAQVSDNEMAAFNGGGAIQLAEGEMERLIQDAIDFESALVAIEVMNQMEWMHVTGSASNTTMEGGECNGLITWITTTNGAYSVATGGTSTIPVQMQEMFLKDGGRGSAQNYPALHADTYLVPPELIPDFNSYVANGAGRPVAVTLTADQAAIGLPAGVSVSSYNDGFAQVKIEVEPYLSPAYNTSVSQPSILAIRKAQIKQADLIPFGANPLAKTDTSIKRLINCVFTQEHSVAKHTYIIPNVTSAVA